MSLDKSITQLKGIGSALSKKLSRLDINTVQDLILHLPCRYEDRTQITPIRRALAHHAQVLEGEIIDTRVVLGRRRSLKVEVRDRSGSITLRFFHFSNLQRNQLSPGKTIRCYGEVSLGAAGLELYHPEYQVVAPGQLLPLQRSLTPIYPATEGISQPRLRQLVQQALRWLGNYPLPSLLPEEHLAGLATLMDIETDINSIINYVHSPPAGIALQALIMAEDSKLRRLIYEELLSHQVSLLLVKDKQHKEPASALTLQPKLHRLFLAQLPFQLTSSQHKVVGEISYDLQQPHPMQRLLQGDVGCGKTLVAALAILHTIGNGKQAALMVPTEILAQQHWHTFNQWLAPLGIQPILFSGKIRGKQRAHLQELMLNGAAQLVIGTHALFQEEIVFTDLALVVIDEQHRFGVNQRLALNEKGSSTGLRPHQLIMTATPIPRTLAMSYYGAMDCSIIDELPPGRRAVQTALIHESRRPQIIERVFNECKKGTQVYWVCTLIEESEVLQSQAAELTAVELREALPQLRIELIHGRMKSADKERIMKQFSQKAIDVLVATTVIEVGVDVANASLMIIENAERLGLSQLHQLRGRVGRGERQSYCVLLFSRPLSEQSQRRLQAMRRTQDGFEIAEIDLQLRGPGELMGVKQTGELNFRVADIQRDFDLLKQAKQQAPRLLRDHGDKAQALIKCWLPKAEQYGRT